MKVLTEIGRAEKLEHLFGTILRGNHGMLSICRELGFKLSQFADDDAVNAELALH